MRDLVGNGRFPVAALDEPLEWRGLVLGCFWFRFLVQKYAIWLERSTAQTSSPPPPSPGRKHGAAAWAVHAIPPPPRPPATALQMTMGASDPFFMGVSDA